ncbi:MAG TPA: hypothetical protein VM307_02205 [Egibacteraceae bacterium]|nr:hypothetical protein [Egibacteraceae bacterium]
MTHVRTVLQHGSKLFFALLATALVFTWTGQQAQADHQPADKVVASGGKVAVIPPAPAAGGVTILSSQFRTSSPTDLMIHVTLECSILTTLRNEGGSNSGRTSTSEAEGQIRVWVEFDGKVVPIKDVSSNPQPKHEAIGDDTDKVTFCENERKQTLADMEDDGHDTLETYHRTKTANAFNWIRLNTGNGIHTLEVKADLRTDVVGDGTAEGYIGNRMLIVEPTKMSNHASF